METNIKVQDLQFEKIEGNAPVFTCNMCGGNCYKDKALMADVKLEEDSSDTVCIVVCSQQCLDKFKAHPGSQYYLDDLIKRVTKRRTQQNN